MHFYTTYRIRCIFRDVKHSDIVVRNQMYGTLNYKNTHVQVLQLANVKHLIKDIKTIIIES